MGDHRVIRTEKQTTYVGGSHRHIAGLCLAEGGKVSKATAIVNIESGRESYWTSADGQRATVRVVNRCERCADKYLRTDRDTTTKDNLLELPDC